MTNIYSINQPQANNNITQTALANRVMLQASDIYFGVLGLGKKPYIADPVTLDYRKIDPLLTPEEVKLYEQAENKWYEIMDGMTYQTLYTLRKRIEENGVQYKRRILTNGSNAQTGYSNDGSAIVIRIDVRLGKKNQFKTSAHELVHALHDQNTEPNLPKSSKIRGALSWTVDFITPTNRDEIKYNEIYDTIQNVVQDKILFIHQRKPKHFKNALSEVINDLPIQILRDIKPDFTSEVIAHSLESTIATSKNEQQETLALAEGFKVAVALINERLTAQHPGRIKKYYLSLFLVL